MALVNLRTDLKSLRYGKDRRGGGSSNQPYIKSPIPKGEGPGLGDEDFLLRGGSLTPVAIANDVSRLSQMFFDFKSPNGLLFTAKQQSLSKSAVNILAGKENTNLPLNNGAYSPTSTLAQAAALPFGRHLLKQGLDPTANTSEANSSGILGGILSSLTGNSNPLGNPIYFDSDAYTEKRENLPTSRLVSFFNTKIATKTPSTELYRYSGGPGSDLGVGNTIISLSKDRTGRNNPTLGSSVGGTNDFFATEVDFGYNDYSVFKRKSVNFHGAKIFNGKTVSGLYENATGTDVLNSQFKTNNSGTGPLQTFSTNVFITDSFKFEPSNVKGLENTLDYDQLMAAGNSGSVDNAVLQDFRQRRTNKKDLPSLDYTNSKHRIDGRVHLGDPGKKTLPATNYQAVPGKALDKINALQIYKSNNIDFNKDINDLCKFRIGVIDNDNPSLKTYIHFRAFIDSMDDNYSAEWSSQKFAGRAENLYNYQGFDRNFNISWTVAAQSKQELIPMYQKLNYLASVCAPDYSSDGYMRGNLIELTVGGYLFNQVGIMTGINYTVPMESPWEIATPDTPILNESGFLRDENVKELPFIIKVSGFNFIPIHNFVPNVQKNKFSLTDMKLLSNISASNANPGQNLNVVGNLAVFGDERYIALSNGNSTNY